MNRLPDGASRVNRPAPKSVNSEAGFCELTGASQPQVSMACVDDVSGQVSVMSSTPQLVAAYVQARYGEQTRHQPADKAAGSVANDPERTW